MTERIVRHPHPVWAERVDHELQAPVEGPESAVEVLPVATLPSSHCIVCALPFFIYGYSLGDEVETKEENWLGRRVAQSETYTYRVSLEDRREADLAPHEFEALVVRARALSQELEAQGFPSEWYSPSYGAIGAPSHAKAEELVELLRTKEAREELRWEAAD
jgi:hypothetical protein